MKLRILSAVAVTVLILAIAFSVSAPAAPNAAAKAVPAANATPTPAAEPHPQIREAIAAMRIAKEHMEHAAHDFGGHRVEAIRATDEALKQLEMCLKFDRE